nr:tRNA (adenosine(37)-N6)-dimethylallyltransferase MiaA [Planctomycetota bacterium]
MRVFLLGPTASGKTEAAVAWAQRCGAEILSMDSMLVYRGMDLGTAKPSLEERGGVPHHLMDLVEPHQEYSVSRWVEAAAAAEREVRARGRLPLYVGGTGLYFKAITAGLFEGPSVPPALRAAVEAELADGGRPALRAELSAGDPELHARIHAHDDKRLVRGVETLRATGRALSDWQRQWPAGDKSIGEPAAALVWPRAVAHARIEARFDRMLADGLVDEVRAILGRGGFGRAASMALGYRQVPDPLSRRRRLAAARRPPLALPRRLGRGPPPPLPSSPDPRSVGAPAAGPLQRPAAAPG